MSYPTGFNSNADLLDGSKLYIERARKVLPLLVRQARAGETIYYSDLAEEVGMPNPRNLNYVLGAIGNALEALGERRKVKKIPVINCIVINKSNSLPGDGIGWFIDKSDFDNLSKSQKKETVNRMLTEIYAYQNWDWVLIELGLEPVKIGFKDKYKFNVKNQRFGSGGESKEHLDFKNYLVGNPSIFGLHESVIGRTEYSFPSNDTIDVLFENNKEIIGVEAKSIISDANDILRGLFQCVKYQALIEAEQKVNDTSPNCHVYLALEGNFPKELVQIKNTLGVTVLDNIRGCCSEFFNL